MRVTAVITPEYSPLCVSLGNFLLRCERAWSFTIVFSDGTSITATIPPEFVCDLYSVPWVFQWLIPKSQNSDIPAWVHDFLLATCGLRISADSAPILTLEECNWCLDYLGRLKKVNRFKRPLIALGVQLGSGRIWQSYLAAGYSLARPRMF